jgi:hypothetical protein
MFVFNCSGELCGLFLLLLFTVGIKLSVLWTNSEKIRKVNQHLRPIFNGYCFWATPRLVSLAGLSLTTVEFSFDFMPVLHHSLAILLGIILVLAFSAALVIQIKAINSKLEYLSESRFRIGLVFRIDYTKDFEMDCITFSMLYYPVINITRLIIAHICLGFAPNFHYVQFGGCLAAQVFYFMIQITCPGYNTIRHKVMSPILDFIYSFYLVLFIGIGKVYEAEHFGITINLEIIGFALLVILLFGHLVQSGFDVVHYCQMKNQLQE